MDQTTWPPYSSQLQQVREERRREYEKAKRESSKRLADSALLLIATIAIFGASSFSLVLLAETFLQSPVSSLKFAPIPCLFSFQGFLFARDFVDLFYDFIKAKDAEKKAQELYEEIKQKT